MATGMIPQESQSRAILKFRRDITTMNCKEQRLPELEISTGQVREALSAILHTILL